MIWPWLVMTIAWCTLLVLFALQQTAFLDHDYLIRTSHLPWWLTLGIFLIGWQLMIAAMMLPSAFSVLVMLPHTDARKRPAWLAQTGFLLGYGAIWTGFAGVAFVGDTLIHDLVQHWQWLATHPWWIGITTLALAGGYQWTVVKQRCLRLCCTHINTCRLPNESTKPLPMWRVGWRYGRFCLGSSWAFMLVMFGLGMRQLPILVSLAAIMFFEREVPGGQRFRPAIGLGLLVIALLWALFPL